MQRSRWTRIIGGGRRWGQAGPPRPALDGPVDGLPTRAARAAAVPLVLGLLAGACGRAEPTPEPGRSQAPTPAAGMEAGAPTVDAVAPASAVDAASTVTGSLPLPPTGAGADGTATSLAAAEAAVTVAVATLTAAALPGDGSSNGGAAAPAGTPAQAQAGAGAPEGSRQAAPAAGEAAAPAMAGLTEIRHVYQKWNNCAPSAAVMLLSAFGIDRDQLVAAATLKPDGKDTNVSPHELAAYLRADGLEARVIFGADPDLLRRLLDLGLPVIAEQWISVDGRGEMGHYRVISGYEDGDFLHQDSYYGPNRRLTAAAFDAEWRPFGRAMVLAYLPEEEAAVAALLGPLADRANMFRLALARAEDEAATIGDAWSHLALAEARARVGDWAGAAAAGDEAMRQGLPFRALWYQFGYYQALHALGRHEDLLARADATLAPMKGEQLEESQYWRGMALRGLGREDEARAAFEAALRYHPGWAPAERALAAEGG